MLVVMAAVAFASAPASASFELSSGGATLRLSENGAVESLAGNGSAGCPQPAAYDRVMPAAEAFTLQLLDAKGEPTRLKSSEFAFVPHAKSAKCAKPSEKKLRELGELGVRYIREFYALGQRPKISLEIYSC